MESSLLVFFTAAITALAVENVVFMRALGIGRNVLFLNSPKAGILYGGVFTWMVCVSSVLVALVNRLLEGSPIISLVRAPLYLVGIAGVFAATYLLTRKFLPKVFRVIKEILPVTTFNTALFGVCYTSAVRVYGFYATAGYALGTGLGYTAAILIIYYARKRLAISPISRSMRGLPILLVYLGLLSLALYGLVGRGLPT